ncbi:MAG: hypothetical protein MAG715_00397 [Methanonatronarchaeales archaeon]|nr:hypothetical protein [Methanonatronarchaeales archaeon]
MPLYDLLAELQLEVEGYGLELLEREVSGGFDRVTTEVSLHGGGETGRGEDVTYAEEHHFLQRDRVEKLPLEGSHGLDSFSELLGGLDLFPEGPERDYFVNYRRWGFESAALDLALRQEGTDLAAALNREYRPVRFVFSPRLGDPPLPVPTSWTGGSSCTPAWS